ncbi:unnamed protein product [Adineta steineri]|uniref:RNA polymerase II elongation factor ELL N-terminal domain-containing protein n=1 Tax=Adineta steineri TaxID=433720 RepID=A0A813Q0J8_9BILA|nr:unnamed protein product [Adineta steineri]
MDRNLPGNNRFRLNADATSNHDGKLHIFIKLTSSCMEAIETYMKQNKKQNLSNIKFNGNGGQISIPINNNEEKCIKQINRNQLEICGLIEQRIVTNQEKRLSPTTNTQSSPSNRPLRERLIHLLAVRTYKKPDLLCRLKSEGGMRDDEKEQLDSLLSSISTQSNSGDFFLLKSILTSGEVNYDWPFYTKREAQIVRKKIEEHQVNATRSTINKTTNDIPSVSLINTLNRSGINEERNQLDHEEITTFTQNPLSDERMQQLSDMLNKLNNAISQSEKPNELLTNEMDLIDEAEKEYTRLVPEYNGLIDYLKNVSERFISLQQQCNNEQNSEKASKIVDEFFKCENNEGFLNKRQRVIELHMQITHLQKILQRNSPSG